MGVRISLYKDSGGQYLWRSVNCGNILSVANEPTIQSITIGDTTIYYTNNALLDAQGMHGDYIVSSYDSLGTPPATNEPIWGRASIKFYAEAHHQWISAQWPNLYNRVSISNFEYKGTRIPVNGMTDTATQEDNRMPSIYTYTFWYNNIEFIYFSNTKLMGDHTRTIMGFGISANAFRDTYTIRVVPPTEPDSNGGFPTGGTPSGAQDGSMINAGNGGDTSNVAPINIALDVHVDMPETEKPIINHPDGINIALVDDSSLGALNNALWGRNQQGFNDLWLQFQNYSYNPMMGIISCIKLPRWVVDDLDVASGSSSIAIAGTTVDGFVGYLVGQGACVERTFSTNAITQFNSFKDFVGVTVRAYAPFVGWFELDPSLCFGISESKVGEEEETPTCRIDFKYRVDATNGNVGVTIWAHTTGKSDTQAHYTPIASGSGNCAYPVLLAGNDRGISDVVGGFTQIFGGLATMAGGAVTGNVPLAIGGGVGMMGGTIQGTLAQQHTTTVGGVSGSVGYLGYLIPFVQVIKPRYAEPANYERIYGRPSYTSGQNGTVADFEGFYAELDVHADDLGFASASEQKRIIELLANGVHV